MEIILLIMILAAVCGGNRGRDNAPHVYQDPYWKERADEQEKVEVLNARRLYRSHRKSMESAYPSMRRTRENYLLKRRAAGRLGRGLAARELRRKATAPTPRPPPSQAREGAIEA